MAQLAGLQTRSPASASLVDLTPGCSHNHCLFGGGGVQGKTITDWLFPLWQAMTGYLPVVSVTQFVSGRHTI